MSIKRFGKTIIRWLAVLTAICMIPLATGAETVSQEEREWVDFCLICNEGMSNTGGNAGNTMMIVSMNPQTGKIRLATFTWDTFITAEK